MPEGNPDSDFATLRQLVELLQQEAARRSEGATGAPSGESKGKKKNDDPPSPLAGALVAAALSSSGGVADLLAALPDGAGTLIAIVVWGGWGWWVSIGRPFLIELRKMGASLEVLGTTIQVVQAEVTTNSVRLDETDRWRHTHEELVRIVLGLSDVGRLKLMSDNGDEEATQELLSLLHRSLSDTDERTQETRARLLDLVDQVIPREGRAGQ